jgi:hypothetical protein
MLNPEKYFDDIYEYVDLWVSGFTAAYCEGLDQKSQNKIKSRMIESVLKRFDVINILRAKLGLSVLNVDDSYDYFINNLPKYDDDSESLDLASYDSLTENYLSLEQSLSEDIDDVKIYLILMGAPQRFVDNYAPIQKRIDLANRLFLDSGFNKMGPQEVENLLIRMLVVSRDN